MNLEVRFRPSTINALALAALFAAGLPSSAQSSPPAGTDQALVALFEEPGDRHGALGVALHAQGQGLGAAQDQERGQRAELAAAGVLVEGELFAQAFVVADDRAGDRVRVAAEVLGA